MNRFAELLDRLAYEPSRNGKLRLLTDYFRDTPDPDRGYALAAITGALSFKHAKPALIRGLIDARVDPVLFGLSYDYVGDLAETVALIWPKARTAGQQAAAAYPGRDRTTAGRRSARPSCRAARELARRARRDRPLGADQAHHRRLRVGVSARLAKTAAAATRRQGRRTRSKDLARADAALSRSLRLARRPRREARQPAIAPFRPVMLAHAIEDEDFAGLDPADFLRRMEMGRHPRPGGRGSDEGGMQRRLYSRTGEDIGERFPDCARRCISVAPSTANCWSIRERPRADLQRAAAAPQPKGVNAEADQGFPGPPARLRPARRRRRGPARAALRRAPRAPRALRRGSGRPAHRSLAAGPVRDLGRAARRAPIRSAGAGDAEPSKA